MVPPASRSGWSSPGWEPEAGPGSVELLGEHDLLAVPQDAGELLDALDVVARRVAAQIADLALHVHRDRRLVLHDVERFGEVRALLPSFHRIEEPLADDAPEPDRLDPVPLLPGEHPLALRLVPQPQLADQGLRHDRVLGDVGGQIPRPVRPDLHHAAVAAHHGDLEGVRAGVLLDAVHADHRNLELRHAADLLSPKGRGSLAMRERSFAARRVDGIHPTRWIVFSADQSRKNVLFLQIRSGNRRSPNFGDGSPPTPPPLAANGAAGLERRSLTGTRPATRGGTARQHCPLTAPPAVRWNAHVVLSPPLRRPRAPLAAHEPAGGLRGRGRPPAERTPRAPRPRQDASPRTPGPAAGTSSTISPATSRPPRWTSRRRCSPTRNA